MPETLMSSVKNLVPFATPNETNETDVDKQFISITRIPIQNFNDKYLGLHDPSLLFNIFQHKALGANNKKIYSKNTRDRMINEIERIKKILFTDDTVKPTFFFERLGKSMLLLKQPKFSKDAMCKLLDGLRIPYVKKNKTKEKMLSLVQKHFESSSIPA